MDAAARVRLPLLLLRLSVFVVMLAWTLMKFVDPARSAGIFKKFYHLPDIGAPITYTLGSLEVLLLLGFVAGFQKRLTYGAVLLFHAISTVSSYQQYVSAFEGNNLLFYAAWPMLAACFALYTLRDLDTLCTVKA
jgi:putative oxidoreductase